MLEKTLQGKRGLCLTGQESASIIRDSYPNLDDDVDFELFLQSLDESRLESSGFGPSPPSILVRSEEWRPWNREIENLGFLVEWSLFVLKRIFSTLNTQFGNRIG
ncbi:hypothetical protein U1Q18_010488 [Sarracenia purpurea var. burkii]